MTEPEPDTGLPSGWEVRHSNSKNLPYYFHAANKQSIWDPPAGTDPDRLRLYMTEHHLMPTTTAVAAAAAATAPPLPLSQDGSIRASHLLVKHRESRRPSSWKTALIHRTKDEARAMIADYEQRIRSGAITLGDLAATESDCSSAKKRGDLGFFKRGDMQREFEDAAFALAVGQISHGVESPSGIHLIERTG
ncbi:MAG: protein kinase ssp1 [Phylliscum demangeonii]|nr:MAG: protein kinase ssp1 [Phylliscum demangeonii]